MAARRGAETRFRIPRRHHAIWTGRQDEFGRSQLTCVSYGVLMGVEYEPAANLEWIETLKRFLQPDWHDLVAGEWATNVKTGAWSTEAMRGWFLQLYPFIHAFPKFLAEALIKAEDEYSRSFLIDNIRVEKAHAEHWLWMGEGFGIPSSEMIALAEGGRPLLRDVQSLSDWIWYINAKGSLAEAIGA